MTEKLSLGKVFGETLEKMGARFKNLVVLDSDLSNSCNSLFFAKSFPERHFTWAGSEASIINTATGMIPRGKIPLVCGKAAALIGRGFESIRNQIALNNLNIKIVGSHIGLSAVENGAHEMCLEDLSLIQTLPNLRILTPLDAQEMRSMVETMLSEFGPVYLRFTGIPVETVLENNYQFELGKTVTIREGAQICIFSYGIALHHCLEAAKELEKRGISTKVVNISSLEPLDLDQVKSNVNNSRLSVFVEEHHQIGSLGSKVILSSHDWDLRRILMINTKDLAAHGSYVKTLEYHQLDPKGIYETIKNFWFELD